MTNSPTTRLNEIMLAAFKADIASFQEVITIVFACHMLGPLGINSSLEESREQLVTPQDEGSDQDNEAFLDMYDWTLIRDRLNGFADSIAPAVGPDKSTNDMAQELETMARWVRLTGHDTDFSTY